MVGAVIVTQGRLAVELLEAAESIGGPNARIRAVSLGQDDELADARRQIADAIAGVSQGGGVLLFTDVFGGTPTNVSLGFLEDGEVEIITGVNLPMLIKLTSLQNSEEPLIEIARQVRDRGRNSVYLASEVLSSQEKL